MLEHIYSVLSAIGLREPYEKKRSVSSAPLSGATTRSRHKFSPDDVIHMLMDLSRVLERVEVIKKKYME